MICPKCYQDILDNTFCPFCGYELSEENLKKLKESTIKAIPQINNFPFSATGRIERFPYILTNLIAIFVLLIGESIIKHYSSIQQSILLHYAHAALLILFYLVNIFALNKRLRDIQWEKWWLLYLLFIFDIRSLLFFNLFISFVKSKYSGTKIKIEN